MILFNTFGLNYIPNRIISLVPSQTELLSQLGLESETVGITRFCVHPNTWFTSKARVGGTKTINFDAIHQLRPDLIIANKEENVKEQIEQLALNYPVWLTNVNNFEDATHMITDIGALTGKDKKALSLINEIKNAFNNLPISENPLKAAYLIWRKPYMAVGGDTFINDMLQKCGFKNIFANKNRYPEINMAELHNANCQLLLLSSEPYPFKQKHVDELSKQLPHTKMILVDGEFFSWYGSRLLHAPEYFKNLINSL